MSMRKTMALCAVSIDYAGGCSRVRVAHPSGVVRIDYRAGRVEPESKLVRKMKRALCELVKENPNA